jgi:hypothetical protein
MASWIVHLRIAEALLARIPNLDESLFAIGNIAPDAGIPDENWEKFNPPPEITHFKRANSSPYSTCDLDFYRRYLAPFRPDGLNRGALSFRLGYFFHLVTDNFWLREIAWPTQTKYAPQFAADKGFIWEVKHDWYGLDQRYVRENKDSLFWRVFLRCGYERSDLDFLPPDALRQRISYIQAFYQEDTEEIRAMIARPFIYLSAAEMDAFVERAQGLLFRLYQRLWLLNEAAGVNSSALEMEAQR